MYFFRDVENLQTDFGTFAPQSTGPLSEIEISWYFLNDFDLDHMPGQVGDLIILADNWLDEFDPNNHDATNPNEFYKRLCDIEGIDIPTQSIINGDGVINYVDFARFVNSWMDSLP